MERHGKNVFMIILSTVWDVRRIEPDKINLTIHMSWEDEFGSYTESSMPSPVRRNDWIQQKMRYPVSLFPLKAMPYLEGFTTATHRSIVNSNVM